MYVSVAGADATSHHSRLWKFLGPLYTATLSQPKLLYMVDCLTITSNFLLNSLWGRRKRFKIVSQNIKKATAFNSHSQEEKLERCLNLHNLPRQDPSVYIHAATVNSLSHPNHLFLSNVKHTWLYSNFNLYTDRGLQFMRFRPFVLRRVTGMEGRMFFLFL